MQSNFSVSSFWDSRVMDSTSKESRVMVKVSIDNLPAFSIAIRRFKCTKLDYDRSFTNKGLNDVQKSVKGIIGDEIDRAEGVLKRLGFDASGCVMVTGAGAI